MTPKHNLLLLVLAPLPVTAALIWFSAPEDWSMSQRVVTSLVGAVGVSLTIVATRMLGAWQDFEE